jgi:hypothetical protein
MQEKKTVAEKKLEWGCQWQRIREAKSCIVTRATTESDAIPVEADVLAAPKLGKGGPPARRKDFAAGRLQQFARLEPLDRLLRQRLGFIDLGLFVIRPAYAGPDEDLLP